MSLANATFVLRGATLSFLFFFRVCLFSMESTLQKTPLTALLISVLSLFTCRWETNIRLHSFACAGLLSIAVFFDETEAKCEAVSLNDILECLELDSLIYDLRNFFPLGGESWELEGIQ